MNTRAVRFIEHSIPIVLTMLAVAIAVLEVVVAVKFQFPVQVKIFDIGFLWLLNLELPEPVTFFASQAGAALWLAMAIGYWVEVFKNKTQKLTAIEITVFTSLAAVPVWGAIVGQFAFSVWLNAGMWVLAAINGARVTNGFAEQ